MMKLNKGTATGLVAGLVLGTVGTAGATAGAAAGWFKTQGPVACNAAAGPDSITCLRTDNRGLATYITRREVMVWRLRASGQSELVWRRSQP